MNSSIEQRVRNVNAIPSDESLEELFGEDLATLLLADVQSETKGRMADTAKATPTPQRAGADEARPEEGSRTNDGTKRSWRMAAAAAVIVVVGGAVLGTIWLGSEGRAAARNVSVAEAMLAAYYNADPAFAGYFDGEDAATDYTRWDNWLFGLDQTGSFECTSLEVAVVTCTVTSQNTLSSIAGIPPAAEIVVFHLTDGMIALVERDGGPTETSLPTLIQSEVRWINLNRPDVYAASFGTTCEYEETTDCFFWVGEPPWLGTAENARVMIDLAPEFFSSNSLWPIGG